MKLIRLIILVLIFLSFSACKKDKYDIPINEIDYKYTFFVAGHTYVNPANYHYGLPPPFKQHFDYINHFPKLEFGVFTGDVVPFATQEYWDSARFDINKIEVPIHIAAGNHDRGPIFDSLYTPSYYFKSHNDLFIILSTYNWNIEGDQKTFFVNTIMENP